MEKAVEVMRVIRVPPRGKLVIQVGNERFEVLSEVADSILRQRLVAAIGELIVFADGYDALVREGVAPPLASQKEVPNQAYSPSLAERQEAFLASLEQQKDAAALVTDSPSTSSIVASAGAGKGDEDTKLNIVSQIDALLQKHVVANPELNGRSVSLVQSPEGGMRIKVDGAFYKHPSEVEDTDVRKALSSALKEWEAN